MIYKCPVCDWEYDPIEEDGLIEVPEHAHPRCPGTGQLTYIVNPLTTAYHYFAMMIVVFLAKLLIALVFYARH